MKVFLTGASGFIGSHFLAHLLAQGREVVCSARSSAQAQASQTLRAQPWIGDLLDSSTVSQAMHGVDVVIHAAGCRDVTQSKLNLDIANVKLTQSVWRAASAAGVQRFVHISAASVLMQSPRPLLNVDESCSAAQMDYLPYSASKLRAEDWLLNANAENMRLVILRPSFVWGLGDGVDTEIGPASNRGQFGWFSQGRYPFATCAIANLCNALDKTLIYEGAHSVFLISDAEPVDFRTFMLSRLQVGGYPAPRFSISRRIAWWLAAFTEQGWKYLPMPGKPPLVREMVRLLGYPFTVSIENARCELGYQAPYAIDEQMRALQKASKCRRFAGEQKYA